MIKCPYCEKEQDILEMDHEVTIGDHKQECIQCWNDFIITTFIEYTYETRRGSSDKLSILQSI